MNITADTNVLARVLLGDDKPQAGAAAKALESAALIAIPLPCFCELAWILLRGARLPRGKVVAAIRLLLDVGKVETNRPAVEAGLQVLEAGGDFADGAIAHEGSWLGGEVLLSFDKKAVALLKSQGYSARLLQ